MFQKDAKSIWQEEVRPLAVEVLNSCRTDHNLTINLESMIVKVDGDILTNRPFHDRVESINKIIGSQSYYLNAHQSTEAEEVKKIKALAAKMNILTNIAEFELKAHQPEVEEAPQQRKRLPNSQATLESVYGISPNKKERVR